MRIGLAIAGFVLLSGCGATERLSVHHIVPPRNGGSDDTTNLTTLCVRCHRAADRLARHAEKQVSDQTRYAAHPAPFRGPDGQPWSRQWYEY